MPVFADNPAPAAPGTYSALASFRAATTGRSCTVAIGWYNAAGTLLSTNTSPAVTDTTTGWTQAVVTATAPTGATQALVQVDAAGAAANELHYVDCAGIFPGSAAIWTRGGLVGTTQATVTRSDGFTLRYADNVALPAGTQQYTCEDVEPVPNTAYTYTAVVSANIGNGVTVTSPSATSPAATATATTWWLADPLTPASSIPLDVVGHPTTVHEQLTTHYPVGTQYPSIVADVVNGVDGQLQVETQTAAQWAQLAAATTDQHIKWLMSPYGDGLYIRCGGASPSTGISGQVKQAQITPSPVSSPYRQATIQYVNVAAP